jgi:hypothetical protein
MPFSVQDFDDLLRLLEERPEWRAQLRRVVLTDDLLRLPEDLAQARQETDRRFRELGEHLAALTAQVATLAGHVGTLRGESREQRYRTRAFAYFGRILRGAHVLTNEELTALLEAAIGPAALTNREAHEVALADLVVRGRRQPDGALVHLVVEVSVGAGLSDVERAVERDRPAGAGGRRGGARGRRRVDHAGWTGCRARVSRLADHRWRGRGAGTVSGLRRDHPEGRGLAAKPPSGLHRAP